MKRVYIIVAFLMLLPSLSKCHKEEIQFLRQFIQPDDLVFDVGANIGKKTELYLTCGARVVCIDPQPNCIDALKARFSSNPQVSIEPVGLANRRGILTLSLCSGADTISTFSQEWQQDHCRFLNQGYRWDGKIEVPVITLDELIMKYGTPQFCKIDVENFEYEVLQGLSKPIACISFEFAQEILHNTQKCIAHLRSLGYKKFNFAIAEEPRLALTQWVSADEIIRCIEYTATHYNWDHMWALWGDVYARYE